MINILHLIPTLEGGGAERQLSMLAAEQSKRGARVHIGVRRGGVFEKNLNDSDVSIHFLGDYRDINPLLSARIIALIARVKPDIIHTWLPQMDILGGAASLWHSIPWILSERTSQMAFKRFGVLTIIRHMLARRARAIIANSAGGAAYWHDRLGAEAAITRISNAIDMDAIRRATFAAKAPDHDCKPQLLVVGRLAPEKALETIVEAARLVPADIDFHILVIGNGPLRPKIEAMIAVADLEGRISLMHFRADWWEKLKNARGLISMSRFEGQPNVVLETMAGKCPLIVSDIPAHREFLDETSALLVPVDDPAVLAAAIISIVKDSATARQRAICASNKVAHMTVEAAATAYELVYQQAINGIHK